MKRITLLLGIFLIGAILFGCALNSVPAEKPVLPEVALPVVKEGWEKELERALAEARKEGKVTIYSTIGPEPIAAWTKHFKNKYGITVEYVAGRGEALVAKILTEKRANINLADLYIGGGTSIYTMLKPAGAIEPFEKELFLPEVIDPVLWFDSRLPWLDAERAMFSWALAPASPLVVNTSLVKQREIQSFRDLLNPKWKGNIVMQDPTVPGMGLQWFTMYGVMGVGNLGLEYMRDLVKQNPILSRDRSQMAYWLARNKYPVSIAMGWSVAQSYADAGAPVAINDIEEPVYLSAGSGHLTFVTGHPHRAAARLFANWLLTKEGQLLTAMAWGRQSAREDLDYKGAGEKLLSELRREGVKYVSAETEEAYKIKDLAFNQAREIFGPLAK